MNSLIFWVFDKEKVNSASLCESFMSPQCVEMSSVPSPAQALGPPSLELDAPPPPQPGNLPQAAVGTAEVGQLGQPGAPHVPSPCQPWKLHTGAQTPSATPPAPLAPVTEDGPAAPRACVYLLLGCAKTNPGGFSLLMPCPALLSPHRG